MLPVCYPSTLKAPAAKALASFFANVTAGWAVETDQSAATNLKNSDLQTSAVITSGSIATFTMTHKMGLANIKMAAATAANSKETLTLNGNTSTTQYSSATTDNAFYALDEFVTNLPYKVGSRNTSGLSCYFIVHPASSYTFSTSYKYGDADANRQWNNFTISSSSNTITSSKYKEITTSIPKFKNLGRLYSYTGTCQTYTPTTLNVKYQIECWGAAGGSCSSGLGYGGYTKGEITISTDLEFYIYAGKKGSDLSISGTPTTSFNGGGSGTKSSYDTSLTSASGGGATDVRTKEGLTSDQLSSWAATWNNTYGLRGRIMVAAGGAGQGAQSSYGYGGGLNGGASSNSTGNDGRLRGCTGATQTTGGTTTSGLASGSGLWCAGTNGTFGIGGNGGNGSSDRKLNCGGGGGGGYWGGAGGGSGGMGVGGTAGSGGSSYISGHQGCIAIASAAATTAKTGTANSVEIATHYSGLLFSNTMMIDGAGNKWTTAADGKTAMPKPSGGYYDLGLGHDGNGYSRITCTPYD